MFCFTSVNVFFTILILRYCLAHASKNGNSLDILYKIWRISNVSENVVAARTSQQNYLTSCVYYCHKLDYISFYYLKMKKTCICNSDKDSNIDGHETEQPFVYYGIKNERINISYIQVFQCVNKLLEHIYKLNSSFVKLQC